MSAFAAANAFSTAAFTIGINLAIVSSSAVPVDGGPTPLRACSMAFFAMSIGTPVLDATFLMVSSMTFPACADM